MEEIFPMGRPHARARLKGQEAKLQVRGRVRQYRHVGNVRMIEMLNVIIFKSQHHEWTVTAGG
jgi:hypothetical protein